MMIPRHVRAHPTCWAALCLGTAWAVTGNVAHAKGDDLAITYGVGVPIALLLSIEIIARISVRGGIHAALAWLFGFIVALIAGAVSYAHQFSIMQEHGETPFTATLIPLAPDGLMAVATIAMLAKSPALRPVVISTPAPSPAAAGWRVVIPAVSSPRPTPAIAARVHIPQQVRVPIDIDMTPTAEQRARAVSLLGQPGYDRQRVAEEVQVSMKYISRWDRARLKKEGK